MVFTISKIDNQSKAKRFQVIPTPEPWDYGELSKEDIEDFIDLLLNSECEANCINHYSLKFEPLANNCDLNNIYSREDIVCAFISGDEWDSGSYFDYMIVPCLMKNKMIHIEIWTYKEHLDDIGTRCILEKDMPIEEAKQFLRCVNGYFSIWGRGKSHASIIDYLQNKCGFKYKPGHMIKQEPVSFPNKIPQDSRITYGINSHTANPESLALIVTGATGAGKYAAINDVMDLQGWQYLDDDFDDNFLDNIIVPDGGKLPNVIYDISDYHDYEAFNIIKAFKKRGFETLLVWVVNSVERAWAVNLSRECQTSPEVFFRRQQKIADTIRRIFNISKLCSHLDEGFFYINVFEPYVLELEKNQQQILVQFMCKFGKM